MDPLRKDDLIEEQERKINEIRNTLEKKEKWNMTQDSRMKEMKAKVKGIQKQIEVLREENRKTAEENTEKLGGL